MHKTAPLIVLAIAALLVPAAAQACLWDRDTLAMERARFPEINELIVGYFPRHSPAYFQWRLEQVSAIPVDQRTAADYDDIAVSHDKLGQHQQAIDTMLAKLERYPDQHLYETFANLGTFHIHNGDLEQGVEYIGTAIEINPDAHFGREVYQKLLVEYVIQQNQAGNHSHPLTKRTVVPFSVDEGGFAGYVLERQGMTDSDGRMAEIDRAIKGVAGMMRFGNYDSPALLEALGDLLAFKLGEGAPQRLAARAYLKASYEVESVDAEQAYREKAQSVLHTQQNDSLENIEAQLKEEIAHGDAYYQQIVEQEKRWIEQGKDLDAEFRKAYYQSPVSLDQAEKGPLFSATRILIGSLVLAGAIMLLVVLRGVFGDGKQKAAAWRSISAGCIGRNALCR